MVDDSEQRILDMDKLLREKHTGKSIASIIDDVREAVLETFSSMPEATIHDYARAISANEDCQFITR